MAIDFSLSRSRVTPGGEIVASITGLSSEKVSTVTLTITNGDGFKWILSGTNDSVPSNGYTTTAEVPIDTKGLEPGDYSIEAKIEGSVVTAHFAVVQPNRISADVTHHRSGGYRSQDQALWVAIRNHSQKIGFDQYSKFIDTLFRNAAEVSENTDFEDAAPPFSGTLQRAIRLGLGSDQMHTLLSTATEVYLAVRSGLAIDPSLVDLDQERGRLRDSTMTVARLQGGITSYLESTGNIQALPYIRRIAESLVASDVLSDKDSKEYEIERQFTRRRVGSPALLELIWSYWMEEAGLSQAMYAITRRVGNESAGDFDPLTEFELDCIRPVSAFILGANKDLRVSTIKERALEYAKHYGILLQGNAVKDLRPADVRTQFLPAYHDLLRKAVEFIDLSSNTQVEANPFHLHNAIRHLHLVLSESAHNAYVDVAWRSRAEMLSQQWILSRPETREFLRGRYMVPYSERWMGPLDMMNKIMRWNQVSVSHFSDLAHFGEQLVLSVRMGDWRAGNTSDEQARNWADYWRFEIQQYVSSYHAVTGVDITGRTVQSQDVALASTSPAILLQRRYAGRNKPAAVQQVARRKVGALGYATSVFAPTVERVTLKQRMELEGEE